ncbi:hypothetical protein [Thermoproteus tenax]|uniref:Uncharacterized protein n=1 Tax=Thermoproteus tenax (strain ATCC 35583 / DSM 2078 / JCM 9277 / NBRC 100435 / Kra 1) TaxID=768679 RepID=G4RLN1_THETK|nr:hypothetical protein [Thermoproteus tenax]CCC82476.1 hypothetical protein TTX_1858 [Thermoproteus tenax Kra 1]
MLRRRLNVALNAARAGLRAPGRIEARYPMSSGLTPRRATAETPTVRIPHERGSSQMQAEDPICAHASPNEVLCPEEGRAPPGPMPDEPAPEVSWMPMKAWARGNPAL